MLRVHVIPCIVTDMPDINIAIADRVRGVAAKNRFTQKRVAEVLGLSTTTIADRYRGKIPFTGSELFTLASTFAEPVERFFPEQVAS